MSEHELAVIGLEPRRLRESALPRIHPYFNEVEEQVLADLGLSRILPPPR